MQQRDLLKVQGMCLQTHKLMSLLALCTSNIRKPGEVGGIDRSAEIKRLDCFLHIPFP